MVQLLFYHQYFFFYDTYLIILFVCDYIFRFDTQLNDILDPQYASVESKMDSRMQSQYRYKYSIDNFYSMVHAYVKYTTLRGELFSIIEYISLRVD